MKIDNVKVAEFGNALAVANPVDVIVAAGSATRLSVMMRERVLTLLEFALTSSVEKLQKDAVIDAGADPVICNEYHARHYRPRAAGAEPAHDEAWRLAEEICGPMVARLCDELCAQAMRATARVI